MNIFQIHLKLSSFQKCRFLVFVFLNLVTDREYSMCVCVIPHPSSPVSWLIISSCLCICVYLCIHVSFPFTAVISAHPIHSLDNHHHHYHMGSLASPTRSYLYHQGSGHPHPRPHACATPISHLDRVDSTGETMPPAGQQEKYRVGAVGPGHIHSLICHLFIHSHAAAILLRPYFSFPKVLLTTFLWLPTEIIYFRSLKCQRFKALLKFCWLRLQKCLNSLVFSFMGLVQGFYFNIW